jgi:hypothetical protein
VPALETDAAADVAASVDVASDAPSSVEAFELPRETVEPRAAVAGARAGVESGVDIAPYGVREIESAVPTAVPVPARTESSAPPEPARSVALPPLVEPAPARANAPEPAEQPADEPPVRTAAPEAQAVDVARAEPTHDAAQRRAEAPAALEEASAPPLRRRARVQELPFNSAQGKPRDYVRTTPSAERMPPPRPPREARAQQGPYGATPSDAARAAAPAPETNLAFGPSDGSDRSPLAWAARLADSLRDPSAPKPVMPAPASPSAAAAAAVAPVAALRPGESVAAPPVVAVAVSPQARSLLQPLVGIDPAEATFVQGPAADALTNERRADAVAIGSVVALGREFAGDTSPEGLGLLAHELTHVARRVAPRFVPPIARAGSARRSTPTHTSVPVAHQTAVGPAAQDDEVADEEATALRVEGRVRAAAAAQTQLIAPPVAPPSLTTGVLTEAVAEPGEPAVTAATRPAKWGGLPAPWEPMPFDSALGKPYDSAPDTRFDVGQRATSDVSRDASVGVAFDGPVPAAFDGSAHAAIHAADDDRQPEEVSAGATPGASPEKSEPKPPDLDRLARQVYSVLKRRLQADAAREWA